MRKAAAVQVARNQPARSAPAAAAPKQPDTPKPSNDRAYVDPSKASSTTQWNEHGERPVMMKAMSTAEIEEFRIVLAKTYEYELDNITYEFEPIKDVHDVDRTDCVWLVYYAPRGVAGMEKKHSIWKTKITVPAKTRELANHIRETELLKRATQPAQPTRRRRPGQGQPTAPTSSIIIEEITVVPQIEYKKT